MVHHPAWLGNVSVHTGVWLPVALPCYGSGPEGSCLAASRPIMWTSHMDVLNTTNVPDMCLHAWPWSACAL